MYGVGGGVGVGSSHSTWPESRRPRVLDGLEEGKCRLPRRGLFVQMAAGWVRRGFLGLILRTMPSRALTPASAL